MAKQILVFLIILCVLLAACTPSSARIQSAIIETQTAWTQIPSMTPYETNTPYPTYTPLPTYTQFPTPKPTNTPVKPTATKVPTATPTLSFSDLPQQIGPISDGLGNSFSVEMQLTDVKWLKIDDYKEPKKGNIFVTVSFKFLNLGPGSIKYFGQNYFQALDENGVLHDYELLPSTEDTCQLESVDLMPNGKVEGCVSFEVPINGKIEFIYAPYHYENLKAGRYLSFVIR